MALDYLQILDGLRATRDPDSCLRGLNLFRNALRGEDGPAFLARYLRQSPEWQELQAVWDAQLTVQHYHVTVTLLLTLSDALRAACAAAEAAPAAADAAGQRGEELAAGAARLASSVLQRRLKPLYFCLSSDMRGKANAALALLEAVVAACGGGGGAAAGGGDAPPSLHDFVRAFDWSLSALPGLARPPREKKGESAADARRRCWQQWALGDPLKRPTRAAFCSLALALLRRSGAAGDALLAARLLRLRPLLGGLLHHLASDPPAHQLEVLLVLQRRVLSPRAALPAAAQAAVLSDAALQQLAAIAAAAGIEGEEAEGEEEEEGGGGGGDKEKAGGEGPAARQAAAAAQALLLAVATSPAHGLAGGPAAPRLCLEEAGSQPLQPGQRRLLRLLLRLRPADSPAHLQLLLAAAEADAHVAAALLLALPYSLEPAAASAAAGGGAVGRWFVHAGLAARLLQLLPAAAPPGLAAAAGGGGGAPTPGGRRCQALLRCCLPPCLSKAALSRGLQHSGALVRHGSLLLLVSSLSALHAVLRDCAAAARLAAARQRQQGAPGRQGGGGWLALAAWLRAEARRQLPDPTLLLALLAAAEREGWEAANELQLSAVLRALLLWQAALPAALADANVEAARLLPAQPLPLRPSHQLLLLELLQAAADAAEDESAAGGPGDASAARQAAAGGPAAAPQLLLLPLLRLRAGPGVAPGVRAAARRCLLRCLLGCGACGGAEEEAVLWLDLLPSGGPASEALASFLSEAVLLLLRRPHEFFEQRQQLLAAAAADGSGGAPQCSLLALCALRQALRMLPSPKIAAGDRAAVAAYVADVLRQLARQQLGAAAAAALAAVLLGVARAESARQQQQQGKQQGEEPAGGQAANGEQGGKEKKRKAAADGGDSTAAAASLPALPPEGQLLLELLLHLEQQGQQESDRGRQGGKKKRRKSGSGGDAAADVATLLSNRFGEPGACLRLVDQLADHGGGSSDSARLLAALQQGLAGSGEGTCAAVLRRCLHWLEGTAARGEAPPPSALATLRATLAESTRSAAEGRRCLRLLAGSGLVATALSGDGGGGEAERALAGAVAAHLLATLQPAADGGSTGPSADDCRELLDQVAAAFRRSVLHPAEADQLGGGAVARFLLLLPAMPAAAVGEAAGLLLEAASPGREGGGLGDGNGKKKKQRKREAVAALTPGWLSIAAAAVLGHHLATPQPPSDGQLEAACGLLLRLADSPDEAVLAAVAASLLQLLGGPRQGAAFAALQADGQHRLLRRCLAAPTPNGGANLAARGRLAALLVGASDAGRAAAAAELLPALLHGGGLPGLALALQPAVACLEQQVGGSAAEVAAEAAAEAEAEAVAGLAAALGDRLLSFFASAPGSLGMAVAEAELGQRKRKKEKEGRRSDAGERAAGDSPADAAARQLLHRHALPCLRLALRAAPLPPRRRQQLLAALLPEQGCLAAGPGPGPADAAEAAVALLCSGVGPSVAELAACVRCFAALLAALLRQPAAAASSDEARLLALLDGPVGDAVAALAPAQRCGAAFAQLATTAADGVGTAVLRHRLAPAAGGDGGAAQAAGVAAVRVLRRFLAALLPEEEEGEGEGEGGDGEEGGSQASSSDSSGSDDEPAAAGRQPCQQSGLGGSPQAASAALQLLQRLLAHSRFLPALRGGAAACPPPLPAAAAQLPRPLPSLLPLAAAADDAAGAEAAGGWDGAAELKKELCEVLETLLDLHQRYGGSTPAAEAAEQLRVVEAAEGALLPLLMASYGASCSPADAAAWSLAAAINRRRWERQQLPGGGGGEAALGGGEPPAVAALLHGPLGDSCFAWGPAAAALQPPPASEAAAAAALRRRLPLDPARAALTVCHWPEACALADPGSCCAGGGGGTAAAAVAPLPAAAAAYDPGFLLPFCCACLRRRLLPPRAFVEAGLLSVCLRGLAAADPDLRGAAYQAVALFDAQLAAAAAPDFREKQQLSVLLGALRAAVTRPFQRLPAVHAVFLAEAALLSLHPGEAMYPAVCKQLARRAVLDLGEVPLLGQLLLAGGAAAAAERRWLLALLLAGLRCAEDASLYHRRHVAELAMSLADSCVVEPGARALALRMLCVAACIPRAARQLAHTAGLIPWLAAAADAALQALLQPTQTPRADAAAADAAAAALQALRRLLRLRSVMRGGGGAAAAQQMVAAALRLAPPALSARAAGGAVASRADPATAASLSHLLAFLREVEQLGSSSGGGALPVQLREVAVGLASLRAANHKLAAMPGHGAALAAAPL